MRRGANWNDNGRRSGGDRRFRIPVGGSDKPVPKLAIQCFERRHHECSGTDTLFGGKCECRCHHNLEP